MHTDLIHANFINGEDNEWMDKTSQTMMLFSKIIFLRLSVTNWMKKIKSVFQLWTNLHLLH